MFSKHFHLLQFGIELPDGTFVVAGAMSENQPGLAAVLHRVLSRLDAKGQMMQKLIFPNNNAHTHNQDGFSKFVNRILTR